MPTRHELEAKDPLKLLNRIKSEFPELTWAKYLYINSGWDHEVIILDNAWVFRFPNSLEYLNLFKQELPLQKYLAKHLKANIPNYTFVSKDKTFAGYKIVPGDELSSQFLSHLTTSERYALVEQLAEFLSKLHTLPLKELDIYKIPRTNLAREVSQELADASKYLKPILLASEYKNVLNILSKVGDISKQAKVNCLTHNDISPEHIFWDKKTNKLGIIDFSDRSLGDPAVDFAELFLYESELARRVYDKYTGPKDSDFLARSRLYLQRAGVYLMIDSFTTDKISFTKAKKFFDNAVL